MERKNGIEGNVSESGDSDNDEERILEEFPKEDSAHMDKINEKRKDKNLQDNVQRGTTMKRAERPKGTTREVTVHKQLEEKNESEIEKA